MSVMPGLGRDRVSLLRLLSSYKIMVSKAIGRYPVVGGTIVPINQILEIFQKLPVLFLYNR